MLIEQSLRFAFKASNNQAEYEALIAGILLAKEMGAKCELPPLEGTKALKMRLGSGEIKSHSLNHQIGRVSLLQIPNLHYEGPKPSFYRNKGWS